MLIVEAGLQYLPAGQSRQSVRRDLPVRALYVP